MINFYPFDSVIQIVQILAMTYFTYWSSVGTLDVEDEILNERYLIYSVDDLKTWSRRNLSYKYFTWINDETYFTNT